jgi:hypothetical protein
MSSHVLSRTALILAAAVMTPIAHAWSSPREAIEQFLRFDTAGGRMSAWPFQKYLAVPDDYDEPGWDMVDVVKSWRIESLRCDDHRCSAHVSFVHAPTAAAKDDQIASHPDGGVDAVEFVAVRVAGEWLLESSNGMPRISLDVYRRKHHGAL